MSWLVAVVLTSLALAGDPRIERVDLGGVWERATPEQAAAGQWEEVTLPDYYGRYTSPAIAWETYRRTLRFDVGPVPAQPVGISIGFASAAYELRVDGELVGHAGSLRVDGGWPREPPAWGHVFEVPAEALADGEVVLEVLTGVRPGSYDGRFLNGSLAIGPLDPLRTEVGYYDRGQVLHGIYPMAIALVLIAGAGGWHLLIWLRRRDQRASLAFTMFTVCLFGAGAGLLLRRTLPHPFPDAWVALLQLISALSLMAAVIELDAWLYHDRPPGRYRRIVQVVCGIGAVIVLGMLPLPVGLHPALSLAVFAVASGLLVWDAVVEWWRGNPDARAFALASIPTPIGTLVGLAALLRTGDTTVAVALVPLVFALLVFGIAVVVGGRYIRQMEGLEATRAAAMRFVPVDFIEALGVSDLTELRRGDARATELTVMFTDIRGFTTRSEQYTAEENFAFVNAFLERMEPCIHANGGFINQFLGDGVMALFPSADGAVAAAAAMQREVRRFAADIDEDIRVGIGMHTGRVMMGTIGGKDRMDATIVSSTQNLAARVEGMTKTYGVDVILTEHTRDALADEVALRELDWVVAKGSGARVAIFELLDGEGTAPEAYAEALAAFRVGDLERAADGFAACGDDPAARLFLERCAVLRDEGLPEGFDGVTRLRVK